MQDENNVEAVWLPDSFRLDGKVALVTGAGYEKGIGRAIGRAYAAAGAAVGFADLDSVGTDAAAREVRESGGEAQSLGLDVTDPRSVTEVVSEIKSVLGPVDMASTSSAPSAGSFERKLPSLWYQQRILRLFGNTPSVALTSPVLHRR